MGNLERLEDKGRDLAIYYLEPLEADEVDEIEYLEKLNREYRDHILRLTEALKDTEVPKLRERIQVLKCELLDQSHSLLVAQSSIAFWQRFAEMLQRKLCASDVEVAMVYGGVLKRGICEASDIEIKTIITEEITIPARFDYAAQE